MEYAPCPNIIQMKSSRVALPRDVALPGEYASFFSFPIVKGGYSGVAVYTKSPEAVPLKAEEGLSGKLQPKIPLTSDERISPSYPSVHDIIAYPDEEENVPVSFDHLDSEGRGLVLDFGLFVLINVYCPNETSDARLSFKMNYHLMLQERVRNFIEEGREVIVLGDINTYPENLVERYQGWNTKISARETNYGTRIDYILVTRGLLKWIKQGDIQPSLKGSDHCPIYIDLHEEITLDSGETVKLRDAMQQNQENRDPPRLAAKYWEEYSGKQKLLSSFFGKNAEVKSPPEKPVNLPTTSAPPAPAPVTQLSLKEHERECKGPTMSPSRAARTATVSSHTNKKRTLTQSSTSSSSKKIKKESGQATLGSFFIKPKPSAIPSSSRTRSTDTIMIDCEAEVELVEEADLSQSQTTSADEALSQIEADYRLALELSEMAEPSPSPPTPTPSQSKAAWSNLFTPVQAPKCTIHGESTKKFTVNKPGPNKGLLDLVMIKARGNAYALK
ncbi:hypothetical protein PHLCEN_2v13448 [Hermanssonia centrifuga]|uniref:Endonuclease/exonuclease/phosphatase domain-containing protein n=1 Tax=Hermanssonia centrifuga TaxID=98765 RepID=A0A2R6NE91_9APHY|nr:hypothetical protein PHLCEN_2v13448 [Hermanssonia centrifuga]